MAWKYMLMCNLLSFNFKSKETYNPKAPHLREGGLGKWALSPLLRKGPLGGSKNSGFFSQKMPTCVPSGSQFLGASGAFASPSVAQNLIPEVILGSTLHLLSPEHMESLWGYTPQETQKVSVTVAVIKHMRDLWHWHFLLRRAERLKRRPAAAFSSRPSP